MDVIKDTLECINYHWIVIVTTGLYMHLREICLIGFCFEVVKELPFDPSYATLIFIFSTLCLLAEYKLWPRTLKEPPFQLLIIYEIMVAALVTDVALKVIWMPLMHFTWCITQESSKMVLWINAQLQLGKYSQLVSVASYLHTTLAATHAAFCISLLAFLWMLDATETLDSLLIDLWAKNYFEALSFPKSSRINMENPEVAGISCSKNSAKRRRCRYANCYRCD